MSAHTDDQIVAGIQRRLEAIDDLIPEPKGWWGDESPTARVPVRVTAGPALRGGSTALMGSRRRLVIIAAAAMIAALVGAAMLIASQPRPHLSSNGLIAYVPGSRSSSEILVIDPSTRTDRVLAVVDSDGCVEYSPDGRQLAVASTNGLALVDAVSGSVRVVEVPTMWGPLAWSPDGTRVAGLGWTDGPPDGIRVVTVATGAVTTIDTGGHRVYHFSWSPDGRRIAYVAAASLDETGSDPSATLTVVGADGSGSSQLVALPSDTTVVWSPDGTRLLFARYQSPINPNEGILPGQQQDIVSLDVRDRSERNLTHSPEDETDAAWSPDGRWIAFTRLIEHLSTSPDYEVVTMAPDGSSATVQPGGGRVIWSSDSKQLLLYRYRGGGGGGELMLLAADALAPRVSLVVQGPVTFQGCGPTWQPLP